MESAKLERILVVTGIVILLTLGSFLTGWFFTIKGIWPTSSLLASLNEVRALRVGHRAGARSHYYYRPIPENGSTQAYVQHSAEPVTSGYIAYLGWSHDDAMSAVWLIDEQGNEQNKWLLENQSYGLTFHSDEKVLPHGLTIHPDGSIIVNFNRGLEGIVSLDSCNNINWVAKGNFHHPTTKDDDGHIWSWRGKLHEYDLRQHLVRLHWKTGEILEEISLEDIIAKNPTFFTLPAKYEIPHPNERHEFLGNDLFHPNEIEALPAKFASAFPMFSPGDLLISLRNINMVAVIDRASHEVKWAKYGPWVWQHDPDFRSDGRIHVFNNAPRRDHTNIVAITPSSNALEVIHDNSITDYFTRQMGGHQSIGDENHTLVISSLEGRLLELKTDGTLVREIVNRATDSHNGLITNAVWVPRDFFNTSPVCS